MNFIVVLFLLSQPQREVNTVKIVIDTGFQLYQKIVSPAQGDVCNFSPSCSHYAKEAISKYGPLWGSLMAADRLMRCNPWAYEHVGTCYPGIIERKISDPVDHNFIFSDIDK